MRYHPESVRIILSTFVATLGAVALLAAQQPSTARVAPAPFDLTLNRSTRLLVIAPHPDDEALGAAGLIQRVRARGGRVHVVLLTSGDGFPEGVEVAEGVAHPTAADFRGYGARREGESRAALAQLGLAPDDISFLGFPDEGLCRIASTYLFDKRRAFESPYTNRESPPPTEQVVRGARYRGVDIRRELELLIDRFSPTLIAVPHPVDEHPDHCSTQIFTREALSEVAPSVLRRVHVLHYLVHFGQWPLTADGGIGTTLNPPDGFPTGTGRWLSLPLTTEETDAKKRALLAYATQMQVIGRFMLAFGRTNELFLDGEPGSSAACWCDGQNIAPEATPARDRPRPGRP